MARTFNGSIWGNIGDSIAMQNALRRQENREALGGLLDAAKFIEKVSANRNMRDAWQKYFDDRKAAADAAAAEEAAAETDDIENALALEDMYNAENADNIFGVNTGDTLDAYEGSIWDDPVSNVVRFGFDPASAGADYEFMQTFDPNTADEEMKRRAQGIVGTKMDGRWGPKSIAAYNKYMGV